MHILWIAFIGLIVGAFARAIVPGKDPGGLLVTSLVGVGGSLLAGAVGHVAGWYVMGERAGFVASVLGAAALLLVHRAWRDRCRCGADAAAPPQQLP